MNTLVNFQSAQPSKTGQFSIGVNKTNPNKPFRAILSGFLAQFNSPATVIFLAPFSIEDTAGTHVTDRLRESDEGLAGAVQEYSKSRQHVIGWDKQIFLLTKWDIHYGIMRDEFANPDTEEVIDLVKERFPNAWGKFLGMLYFGLGENQKVSPYCAGIINGNSVGRPAVKDRWLVDLYARRVWNQLYKDKTGKALYPELEPRPTNIWDKFANWLRGH